MVCSSLPLDVTAPITIIFFSELKHRIKAIKILALTRTTSVLNVSIASPKYVFLTLAINYISEAIVHEHGSATLSLCKVQSTGEVNDCEERKKNFLLIKLFNESA